MEQARSFFIARILEPAQLRSYVTFLQLNGIKPVLEVYNESDLDNAIASDTKIIGVNARDLDTFEVSIEKAAELIKQVPDHISVIGFSGVNSRKDVEQYKKAGAKAVLVGSSLMKTQDISQEIKILKNI